MKALFLAMVGVVLCTASAGVCQDPASSQRYILVQNAPWAGGLYTIRMNTVSGETWILSVSDSPDKKPIWIPVSENPIVAEGNQTRPTQATKDQDAKK